MWKVGSDWYHRNSLKLWPIRCCDIGWLMFNVHKCLYNSTNRFCTYIVYDSRTQATFYIVVACETIWATVQCAFASFKTCRHVGHSHSTRIQLSVHTWMCVHTCICVLKLQDKFNHGDLTWSLEWKSIYIRMARELSRMSDYVSAWAVRIHSYKYANCDSHFVSSKLVAYLQSYNCTSSRCTHMYVCVETWS